ncbi:MAG: OsmC family protein [Anaerolineaceae bacterium]|nr:OsmC family protein [Anaerolineaceae bacterium]
MAKFEMIGIPNAKKRVDVTSGNYVIITDYTVDQGGEDTGPSMGAMFLAGLVACTASTARGYCKKHNLPIPEKVITTFDMDDETELVTNVNFKFILPEGFPEKRLNALVRASGQCTVKDWWMNPPDFTAVAVIE